MTDRELMQQALEALEMYELETDSDIQRKAIAALRKRLAQQALDKMAENARELGLDYEPEQPKVRTGDCLLVGVCASEGHKIAPQRTWVGLTDEEIKRIGDLDLDSNYFGLWYDFAKAIEAKLRSKNS